MSDYKEFNFSDRIRKPKSNQLPGNRRRFQEVAGPGQDVIWQINPIKIHCINFSQQNTLLLYRVQIRDTTLSICNLQRWCRLVTFLQGSSNPCVSTPYAKQTSLATRVPYRESNILSFISHQESQWAHWWLTQNESMIILIMEFFIKNLKK